MQRTEVTNLLAGGVAHDFNNLLMVVLGKLQSLEWPLRNKEELLAKVRDAKNVVLEGATLTQRLLTLAQHHSSQPQRICLNECIADLLPAIRRTLAGQTELETELMDNLPLIEVDPMALETVLLTLIVNARDAMLGNGRIIVATIPLGSEVAVQITDLSPGFDAGDETDRFSPDFSDRSDSSGKGLGLALSLAFVEEYGGRIEVDAQTR